MRSLPGCRSNDRSAVLAPAGVLDMGVCAMEMPPEEGANAAEELQSFRGMRAT